MTTHLKTILALITLIGIATLIVYYPILLVIFTIFILYVWLYIFLMEVLHIKIQGGDK